MWIATAFMQALRAYALPAWAPYLAVALGLLGAYWYIDSSARESERVTVVAEQSKAKDDAQKYFKERANKLAAEADALRREHAAELAERDAVEAGLAEQWRLETERNAELAQRVCWPLAIVKELRK